MALKTSLHIPYLIRTISISLLIVSCSPQKRLNRLVKKHPELITIDTIRIVDTIIVENYLFDTTTVLHFNDSVTVINNEKVILKYFYDTLRQEIYHEVECIGDTIIKETFIPIEKIVFKELSWWEKYRTIIIILGVLILAYIVLKKLGKVVL